MIAVIFEVVPADESACGAYLEIASRLRPLLDGIDLNARNLVNA
jgi:hypothetical protein